jgi:microcystin-dependent protein
MAGAFAYGMTPTNSPKGSAFQAVQPSVIPCGVIQMFAGSTAPNGWLVCDGSTVSRKTYSDLFKIIGTTYGAGNSNDTFTLPDMRGRTPIGVGTGAGLTSRTLAATTGAETVTLSASNIPSITTGTQSANHTHSGTTSGVSVNHYHQNYSDGVGSGNMGRAQYGFSALGGGYAGQIIVGSGANGYSTSYTGYISSDHSHTITTGNESANHSHTYTNNSLTAISTMPPAIAINFIIKA